LLYSENSRPGDLKMDTPQQFFWGLDPTVDGTCSSFHPNSGIQGKPPLSPCHPGGAGFQTASKQRYKARA
jgi:hypothetical protein